MLLVWKTLCIDKLLCVFTLKHVVLENKQTLHNVIITTTKPTNCETARWNALPIQTAEKYTLSFNRTWSY